MPNTTPPTVSLKDGRVALIRLATVDDAPGLWAVNCAAIKDGRGMVCTVEDCVTLEEYTESLRDKLQTRTGILGAVFTAVIDDLPVAEAEVWRLNPRLVRHVGQLSLEVHPEYQGIGLGRALMEAMIAWCTTGPGSKEGGVLRLGLATRADNDRAIALYRSMEFVDEAIREDFIRNPDGSGYIDDLLMVRFFDDES